VDYFVDAIPNADTYVWKSPTGSLGSSSSSMITIHFSDTAQSGYITVNGHNACGDGLADSLFVQVNRQVSLKVFPEGLYNPETHLLNPVQDENGNHFSNGIADLVNIELHSATAPYATLYSIEGLELTIEGTVDFTIPVDFSSPCFLVIRHRNHLEVWSESPVSFSMPETYYDFSDSVSKAYGNNLKMFTPGVFGLFAGDVNEDGQIDETDISEINDQNKTFLKGYSVTDVNGDGITDALDLILTDNNTAGMVSVKRP
jgi:hypothetical protein